MAWAAVGAAAIGAVGGAYSSSQNKKAAQAGASQTQAIDPRVDNILFGGTGANGLFQQWSHLGDSPTPQAITNYGNDNQNYLSNAPTDMAAIRNTANGLMQGNAAPQSAGASATFGGQAAPSVFGGEAPASAATQINAPAQNSLNLSGAYDNFINGDAGANPYLLQGQQAAINATNAGFAKNQTDLTNNLQRNVLPGLRSGAIGAGQYGSSRQGIAEGNALSDYTNQLTSANTQLAATNSANTTAQQAAAFNAGQDRSLNALNTLSGQQYATATTNAQLQQNNNQFNSSLKQEANNQNQQNNQFNSNLQQTAMNQNQQNNQFNASAAQQNNQFNAGQQSSTNQQNNAAALSGAGLLSGQLSSAYQGAAGVDNYKIGQAGQIAGLLYPAMGANASSTSTQPYYSNTAGNVVGGALGGLSLYNQYNQASGTSTASPYSGSANNWGVSAGTAPTNSSLYNSWYQ